MGRYAPLRGFKVITADFGLSGTSAESPGGAGDDSVLREWCCLVRWRGSQRQFKLTQLPDGQSLQMVIGTEIGFIRRQTLPEILSHLMNLLVGRQFLQASGALTGCCFRTTVFQRILTGCRYQRFLAACTEISSSSRRTPSRMSCWRISLSRSRFCCCS